MSPVRLRSLLLIAVLTPASAVTAQDPGDHHHAGHHPEHPVDPHRQGHHHSFADAERWAGVFDAPERDAWQKPAHVVELMKVAPGMTVVDLGTGTGYFLPYLARAVGEQGKVLGLDVEPAMIEHVKMRAEKAGLANVEARTCAPDDPGLADASVDRVLIVDTWHHIDSRPIYTQKLLRALKPGGEVVVVDFTRDSPQGPPPAMRLSAEEVIREMAAGGLKAKVVEAQLPNQYVVIGTRAGEGGP
ncbi:MAG: methyltransferase domain-containing protein [Thermoanaerobaculia bacterium]|nr:methyltransferase domain-containing protein [Thermoanaerobaculia bacterium]